MNALSDSARGYLAAFSAFFLWGLFPLYWKQLDHVPALEIMLQRVAWCFVFVAGGLSLRSGLSWWRKVPSRLRLQLTASGLLISVNWYLYIWAVVNGHIVETSLGYYINPLVNVAMGTLLLKERLNRAQLTAVCIAALGVLYLTLMHGRLPWIALTLACTFACYGFIRKHTEIDAVSGLAMEGAMLFPLTIAALLWLHSHEQLAFPAADALTQSLLVLGGIVTAVPLILFAHGARRIPYSAVGMLQYLAPSLQLVLGVLIYEESFDRDRLIGFACIWLALAIYTSDGIRRMARSSG